jgi:hypothetical protein
MDGENYMNATINYPRPAVVLVFGAVFAALTLFLAPAMGGLIAGDTNAMGGQWQGTLQMTGVATNPITHATVNLYVDVEYAVYSPGQFSESFSGLDPSNGTEYVYAYQLFNISSSTDGGLISFTVGMDGNEWSTGDVITEIGGSYATGNTSAPNFVGETTPTSAKWSYSTSKRIKSGYSSLILIFTSKYGPEMDFANILGYSGATDSSNSYVLPSPTPEPATAVSLLVALGLFFVYRSRR